MDELVRLQRKSGKVIVVEHRDMRQPGRSIYFCPNTSCLDKVLKRREIVFKRSKYDKIIVRLEPRQSDRLRYAFAHAARRLRARLGVGPQD